MMFRIFIAALTLASLSLTGVANAQTDSQSLTALVAQLQTNPSDDALRRRIIEQARTTRPAPQVPAEARDNFIQGIAITQAATDAGGQRLAVARFNDALRLAPWWGDAYYNRGIAQDLAGEHAAAIASLQFYLLTGPSAQDERETRDRISAIQGRQALAAQNAVSEAQSREAAFWRSIDGARYLCHTEGPVSDTRGRVIGVLRTDTTFEVSGRALSRTLRVGGYGGSGTYGPFGPYSFRRMSGERAIFGGGGEEQEYSVDAAAVTFGSARCPRQ
jgi:hypothetical protein